jgi:ubiquitin carboxyl-terminal hydrolase 8
MLEDALTVGPRNEWTLFCNRDKFEVVAIYDNSSESFGQATSPLSVLVRAIYEVAFHKMLKRMPMLIVGGLDAWRKEVGSDGILRGDVTSLVSESHRLHLLQSSAAEPSSMQFSSHPHQLWTPPDTLVSPLHSGQSSHNEDNAQYPLNQLSVFVIQLTRARIITGD